MMLMGCPEKASKSTTPGLSISKEECEAKGSGYKWNRTTEKCNEYIIDPPSVLTTKVRYEGVQLLSDYGCILKSSDLYCWEGNEDPELVEEDIKEYKLYSYEDLNRAKEGTQSPSKEYAFLLALTNDNELIGEKADGYTDTDEIFTFGRRVTDVTSFQVYGGTICAHMGNKSIKCWGDNRSAQAGVAASPTASFDDDEEDGTVLGHLEGLREFDSFKMFGDKRPSNAGYKVGICGLNSDDRLYCWGEVTGAGTIDIDKASSPITSNGIHRVKLKDGEDTEDLNDVTQYLISEKGHVMYAYGKRGSSNEEWYVFGDGEKGFGSEKIQEEPIRMVGSDEEEDTTNIQQIIVMEGSTQCLITSDDLLRCAFASHSAILAIKADFTKRENETSDNNPVDQTWFTAYGSDEDDIVDEFYVLGSDKDEFCWILQEDRKLECSFSIKTTKEEVSEFKVHENAFCVLDDDSALTCQAGLESGAKEAELEDLAVDAFYMGGEAGNEFVFAQVEGGRIYGWVDGETDDPVFNGDDKKRESGFGDINDEDDKLDDDEDDDDDLDRLAELNLDEIITGSHRHILGRSGVNYYRWGLIDGDEIPLKADDSDDVDGLELEFSKTAQ